MLGSISLPATFGRYFEVYGGPYRAKPAEYVGVKLALEIDADCTVNLPIRDFCTPNPQMAQTALVKIVQLIAQGHPVYLGCMGGKGRTGLMLALLAKAWGISDPIEYVRTFYYAHAVETKEQERFVMQLPITPDIRRAVRWAKIRTLLKPLSKRLTRR